MEEFDIFLASLGTDLTTLDLSTKTIQVSDTLAALFEAEGASATQLIRAEAASALTLGVVDALASTDFEDVRAVIDEPGISLFRFTVTQDGIISRTAIAADAQFGDETDNTLTGTTGPDEVYLFDGDDVFLSFGASDTVFGGAGTDTVALPGVASSYTLTLSSEGLTLEDRSNPGNLSTLSEVENVTFSNGNVESAFDVETFGGLGGLTGPELSQFIELYIAYFNRAPDAEGLGFWGTAFAKGTTLERSAELFIDQPEYRATYPDGTTNADFVDAVYNNVLGRTAETLGRDFWISALDSGFNTRDQFLLEFLKGARAELPPGTDQAAIDLQIADQQFLDTKTDLGTYFAVTLGMSDIGNAATAMGTFTGVDGSLAAAISVIDTFYAAAQDPASGAFLQPLVGVLDNPFPTAPDAPEQPRFAANEDSFTLTEDSPTELNVLANDLGSGLSLGAFTTAANGTLDFISTSGGRLLYTPDADFVGTDTFNYTANSGDGRTELATVNITVENDDLSNDITMPTVIDVAEGVVTSELEEGFDVDWFSYTSDGGTFAIRLTGPAAAEAEFIVREDGENAVLLGGDDDEAFYAPDKSSTDTTTFTIGVTTDPAAQQVPGEDAYTLSVSRLFQPEDLPNAENTFIHVDTSGDGTWSSEDSSASELAAFEIANDLDWFGFAAERGGASYRIQARDTDENATLDVDVIVRDAAGNNVAQGNNTGSEDFNFTTPEDGNGGVSQYYIEVLEFAGQIGTYELIVTEIA